MFRYRLHAELGIIGILLVVAASPYFPTPAKQNVSHRANFDTRVPEKLGPWSRTSTRNFEPSGLANEMFQAYFEREGGHQVLLTLGYSSDERRSYELHYPDVCHRVRGDEMVVLPPTHVALESGPSFSAPTFHWHYPKTGDSAVSVYWFVIDGERTTEVFELKRRQLTAGILGRTFQGVLVRLDVFYPQTETWAFKSARLNDAVAFARDMHQALPDTDRSLFFGLNEVQKPPKQGMD